MENLSLSSLLVFANLIVLIGGMISTFLVVRSSLERGAQEIQERIRTALKDENEILQTRLERVEEDNTQLKDDNAMLKRQIELVIEILKRQGIILEINGELVQVKDAKGSTFTSTRQPAPKRLTPKPKETNP